MINTDAEITRRAQGWLSENFDEETRQAVASMMESNPSELIDSFYRDLEFGTGGLRGIMGAGTNRMNKYTVGMATQGLANYLKRMFPLVQPVSVVVAHDSRNNSSFFAEIVAQVFSANGFRVYLFEGLRPTPELSFAIRHFGCQSGVMITASHNPKEYNGYKAYWDDGAQMIAPHDENVIREVKMITSVEDVLWKGNPELVIPIGSEIDCLYLDQIAALSLSPDAIKRNKNLKIVYTPLHGCGRTLVPEILKRFGFENVTIVSEQATADGNFPTVHSPNPEEHEALNMGIHLAEELQADLVMATDPDADRVGIAIRNNRGKMILLNGNQTAALLFYYILTRWSERKKLTGREYIVSTIVTTRLLSEIARKFGVDYFESLTGFKFIADVIRKHETDQIFIIGGEESYGYLIGDFVRDKDAVSSCAMIAEAAAWMADRGKTLFDLLQEIYLVFGFYKETLLSVTKKGKTGAEEIQRMMFDYRNHPPDTINNSKVVCIKDYQELIERDILNGTTKKIDLPVSNVLQFILEDGSIISMRPSGTEPKIKFYFGVRQNLQSSGEFEITEERLDRKISGIITALNLK
ncbi:MAG: phospho-sugar mutase [Bacteroidales bacterium]|nr:phospho-sugar mutase [Bacteroidales bacterium]HNW72961.1 phospho-sugar mutase [Bacteroidales bacterium]HPS50538.1 phospho-sugar mutase [Bacteroidales bacterium]